MLITNKSGFAFSVDLLCAFIGICLISLVSIQFVHNSVEANAKQLRDFELEKNAVMLLDAMVKNRNAENPSLGAAVFDGEKHRAMENNIDLDYLKQANPAIAKNVFLKSLELVFKDGARKTIIESPFGKNCLGVSRLVLVGGKKALLEGVVCVE